MSLASIELDLDLFSGPFDLLLALILREEIDLLELELADVVLAYLDHLHARGELDLETATEFVVLIAALLELKSRLMLSEQDEQMLDIEPEQALEELLARMLDAHRYRGAAEHLMDLLAGERGLMYRSVALPTHLRRSQPEPQEQTLDPNMLGAALGGLLRMPPPISLQHISVTRVTVSERIAHLRTLLGRGHFSFDEAVKGADRVTVAVTIFALLELYKRGEAEWEQAESFGEIAVRALGPQPQEASRMAG
ncbi:MAG: segregation and condensation protein A [Solirubrobacteraceae bacterium]